MGLSPGKPAHEALAIELRTATAADMDYVYSTWLRSYLQHGVTLGWARGGGPAAKARYYRGQQALIAQLLEASEDGARVMVAGLPDDDATILGWACYSGFPELRLGPPAPRQEVVLHYVYTRQALRRAGIARRLLVEIGPNEYTHICRAPPGERGRGSEWSDWLGEWIRREWPLAAYNPYAVF